MCKVNQNSCISLSSLFNYIILNLLCQHKVKNISVCQEALRYILLLCSMTEKSSARYNIGFISASQYKFSTYQDIYPFVHEIGYKWLGEWTLLIDDGKPGAYLLNDY